MKRINLGKIIWVSSSFLLLIVILLMVIDYKVHYQYLTQKELYFYECSGNLCVSEIKEPEKLMYSKYNCNEKECPYLKKELNDNYVLLEYENQKNKILFNYRTGEQITTQYEDYFFLNQNYIIVSKEEKQGIINKNGRLVVPLEYEQVGLKNNDSLSGYNFQEIIAKKNGTYGIINYNTGAIIEELKYSESNLNDLLVKLKKESNT